MTKHDLFYWLNVVKGLNLNLKKTFTFQKAFKKLLL